jgi:hypothetical protein
LSPAATEKNCGCANGSRQLTPFDVFAERHPERDLKQEKNRERGVPRHDSLR